MKIQIDINTDSDAFKGSDLAPEVLRILDFIRGVIRDQSVELTKLMLGAYPLHDINDNRCGKFTISNLEEKGE